MNPSLGDRVMTKKKFRVNFVGGDNCLRGRSGQMELVEPEKRDDFWSPITIQLDDGIHTYHIHPDANDDLLVTAKFHSFNGRLVC